MTRLSERRAEAPAPRSGPATQGDAPSTALVSDPLPRNNDRWLAPLLGTGSVVAILLAWQFSADSGLVDPAFSSRPTDVARRLLDYVVTAQFRADAWASGSAFLLGLAFAIVTGILLGTAIGWFRWVRFALDPLVVVAYSAPRIALVPIIILWFGIGFKSAVFLVALLAVFPILINTSVGIRTIDADYLELARSLCMSRRQVFRLILLPAAVPSIVSGMRLAVGLGLIGIVVAEFLAGTEGVGYRMNEAASLYQSDLVFAGLVIITCVGLFLTTLLKMVEQHFDRWRI